MRLRFLGWLILAAAVAGPVRAEAGNLRVQLNISNAPPAPPVFYRDTPPLVVVPHSSVYVVQDERFHYDLFRCGVYWYIWNDGYWYRARAYRGPFAVIEPRYVPTEIWNVPSRHWRHHYEGGAPRWASEGRHHDHDYVVHERENRGHKHDDD